MLKRFTLVGSRGLVAVIVTASLAFVGCKGAPPEVAPRSPAARAVAPATASAPATAAPSARAAKKPAAQATIVKPAEKGLDARGQLQFGPGDRCPVCGMDVGPHRKFASAIELKDGATYHFCGTGCMIKTWLHPEIFIGQDKTALKRAVAREYFDGLAVDALSASWVAGSDVVGPMGPALVPLKDDADLKTFTERHGGKTTFKLGELTDAAWKAITGKSPVMRPKKK